MRHDWRQEFPEFAAAIEARCEKGAREYGDASFQRPVDELLAEVQQELEDVAGWSYILWVRLKELRALWDRLSELGEADSG